MLLLHVLLWLWLLLLPLALSLLLVFLLVAHLVNRALEPRAQS